MSMSSVLSFKSCISGDARLEKLSLWSKLKASMDGFTHVEAIRRDDALIDLKHEETIVCSRCVFRVCAASML